MKRSLPAFALLALIPAFAQQTAANWVWYPEAASGECVDQSRYLRKTFDLEAGFTRAHLDLVVDDRQTVFANGQGPLQPLKRESGPTRYDLTSALQPGRNVIALEAHNVTGPAGVLARLEILGPGAQVRVIGSDATWRASRQEQDGWTAAAFDDEAWVPARVLGPAFTEPWMQFPGYHTAEMVSPEELATYRKFQETILAPVSQFTNDPPGKASLGHHKGAPALLIDGVPVPPVMYRGTVDPSSDFGRRQIANFRDAGVHLQCLYTTLDGCWRGPGEYDFAPVDTLIRSYLSVDPSAYLVLHIRLLAPEWWMRANPDEWVRYATSDALDSSDESYRVRRASPASEVWLRDASAAWREMIRHIEDQPWGKRVVGYHAGYGIYTEWHYFGSWSDQYPDTGPAMTRTFRNWLRGKYGTLEALRDGWRDPEITFETAQVPGVAPRKTATRLTLRDPILERPVMDYYRCQQKVIADDIEHFGRIVKEETSGDAIYGVYYGYFFGVRPQTQGGHLELERLLKSPYIDYFVAPYSYSHRMMGEDGRLRSLAAAINAAGKVHFLEGDIRTYLHSRNEYGRTDTLEESLAAVRREFATSLIEHTGFWYVDFGPDSRGGWFDHPEIMAEAARLQKVSLGSLDQPRGSVAEIAVVCDLESGYTLSDAEGMSQAYPLIEDMGTELYHLGAPVDFLLLNQLDQADLPRYKLLVFLNTIQMNPDQAALVERLRLSGNHATVFLWAPGLCDSGGLSPAQASRVTGLDLRLVEEWLPKTVELSGSGAALATGIPAQKRYGIQVTDSVPVPECADPAKWLNPRTQRQMQESYSLYEVQPAPQGITWSFQTTYPWTDIHLGAEIPTGDGVGYEVGLQAEAARIMVRTVIKDANWAEFQTEPVVILSGSVQRLEYPLAAFSNAPWSKLKPERPALPIRGMKFVLDGVNVAGKCELTLRDLRSVRGPVTTGELRSYGQGVFAPALIPSDNQGTVLGNLAGTGDPAVVLCGEGAGSVLFSSAPFIPRDLLAEMVRRAGVHQYIDAPGDVLRADSRFICIHTKDGGPRKLRLPEACTLSDAFTGAVLGSGASVDLTLPRNSTTLLERIP